MSARSTRSRAPRWAAAVALTLTASLAATACGSDEESSVGETEATTGTATEEGRADRAAVDAFCESTDALLEQIDTVASTGDLSSLQGAVTAINSNGAALVDSDPAAAAEVAACMEEVSTALAAAASSSDTSETSDTSDPSDSSDPSDASDPTDTSDTSTDRPDVPHSDDPEVQEFCATAEELAADLERAMADPTSGDLADLSRTAQQLATDATRLMTGNPADAAAITACLQLVTEALTGSIPSMPGIGTSVAEGSDGPDGSMTVDEFCAAAEELGQALEDAMANPASADVGAITARSQELSEEAQELITAHPGDAARVTECLQALIPNG